MKAKSNYSGLTGIISFSRPKLDEALSIAGQNDKVQQVAALYESSNEEAARIALRQALAEVTNKLESEAPRKVLLRSGSDEELCPS